MLGWGLISYLFMICA